MDPDVQEQTPEFVVEGRRIFKPKYKNVSGQHHGVQEEQNCRDDCVSGDDLDVADENWQRPDDESESVWNLDEEDELDAAPTADRREHVEQGPSIVAAVLLEPDDAKVKSRTDCNADERDR